MIAPLVLRRTLRALDRGGVIAYPTEAVWGLGCDPENRDACERLLALKGRNPNKGLILIAANFEQLDEWLVPLDERLEERARRSWPGPSTWIWPAEDWVPQWLTGGRDRIAVRVTAHPVARALCEAFGGPLVSTSANRSGRRPALTATQVRRWLGREVDAIVPGDLGGSTRPSTIRDLVSGLTIRP